MADRVPWKWTEDRRAKFLLALEGGHSRSGAAKIVGIDRRTAQRYMSKDEDFKEKVEAAEDHAVSEIENALWLKAKGGHVTAMIFYLCNRATDRWTHVNRTSFMSSSGSREGENGKAAAPRGEAVGATT